MDWFIANISWIKDTLWVIFTLIATIIAILTYRRARYTLLQPLRSEVVKRQTELMVELLEYISGTKRNIYFGIDYMGIIACNAYKLLELCGYTLADENVGKTVEKNIGGFMFLKSEGEIHTFCVPADPFGTDDENIAKKQAAYKLHIRERIQNGGSLTDLEGLFLTKTHSETVSRLKEFRDNPFMPQSIQTMLDQLLDDINQNIRGPLFKELEMFIVRANSMKSDQDNPLKITYQAMYNDFLRYSKSHTEIVKEISDSIRKYLLVDAKWS